VELDLKEVRNAAMGPAIQLVSRASRRVENEAKRTVRVDTGRLRSSINTKMTIRVWVVKARIGTRVKYGLVEHDGASRHTIRAVKGEYMKFFWKKAGRVVWFRSVRHPGTKGSFFLTTPMVRHLPGLGFRVERTRSAIARAWPD
jgi:hypothetical protein